MVGVEEKSACFMIPDGTLAALVREFPKDLIALAASAVLHEAKCLPVGLSINFAC